MTPIIVDASALAQLELEQYAEEQTTSIAPFEIDSLQDGDFGTLYRLWQGMNLLGTFYRAVSDDKWVAQPSFSKLRPRCDSSEQAQRLIIALSGLLVVDAA
jgi:hypothetical protein